jgi:phospholipase A1
MKRIASLFLLFSVLGIDKTFSANQTNNTPPQDPQINLNKMIISDDTNKKLDEITPAKNSALEEKIEKRDEASDNRFALALYHPTYILPFYYTVSPDYTVYQNETPNNRQVMHSELKAQFSVMVPLLHHMFYNPDSSLNIAYTQLSYWQVYAASQFFRETDYEPEIFVQNHFHRNWLFKYGLDHQSNGLGGDRERSWNRAIIGLECSGENWVAGVRIWDPIFKAQSSNLHNPNIAHYLGYENLSFAYKIKEAAFTIQVQNIESGLQRGFAELTASYPLSKHFLLYGQFFSGYGQSLIEYNHRTNSAGIGLAFNDVI